MGRQIYFNGGYHEETDPLLSIQDRGLCFGDGLFEVIRCIEGRFLLFSKHIAHGDLRIPLDLVVVVVGLGQARRGLGVQLHVAISEGAGRQEHDVLVLIG